MSICPPACRNNARRNMEQGAAPIALDCLLAAFVVHLSGRFSCQRDHGGHDAANGHADALVACGGHIIHPCGYSAYADCASGNQIPCAIAPAFCGFRLCRDGRDSQLGGTVHPADRDYLAAQPVWPSSYRLEDWYWRPFRDVMNCVVVLAIVVWYGVRLQRHQP